VKFILLNKKFTSNHRYTDILAFIKSSEFSVKLEKFGIFLFVEMNFFHKKYSAAHSK